MGILNNIFRKIFPSSHPAVTQAQAPAQAQAQAQTQPQAGTQGSMQSASPQAAQPGQLGAMPPPGAPMDQVDVEAILTNMAQSAGQPLNWRSSIVDLLKLLNLDSSLQARKALAQELHYSGDVGDSAAMNIWLHRQVMNKLAANGGKVPAELKD